MLDVAVARVTKRVLLVMMVCQPFVVWLVAHFSYNFRQEIDDPKGVLVRIHQQFILVRTILGLQLL